VEESQRGRNPWSGSGRKKIKYVPTDLTRSANNGAVKKNRDDVGRAVKVRQVTSKPCGHVIAGWKSRGEGGVCCLVNRYVPTEL
jgi:hypothetical protein